MKNEPLLDFVLSELDKRLGKHKKIAEDIEMSYTTLRNIYTRITPNPGVIAVQDLADYFRDHPIPD